jgi:preprotein translocase subunit Sec63
MEMDTQQNMRHLLCISTAYGLMRRTMLTQGQGKSAYNVPPIPKFSFQQSNYIHISQVVTSVSVGMLNILELNNHQRWNVKNIIVVKGYKHISELASHIPHFCQWK